VTVAEATTAGTADETRVIDTDTHVVEPYDLWTSRVSVERWGDRVPHVRTDPETGIDIWYFGDKPVRGAAQSAHAFHSEFPPGSPRSLAEAHPSTWDPAERLKKMDEYGTYAQVLYPNVAGFGAGAYAKASDPELMITLLRAYNDFLVEYASVAPGRFIPVMAVPFWDVDVAVAEIGRAHDLGHKGIIFSQQPEQFGQPPLGSPHWDPIWRAAEERSLPVNFHIASGDTSELHSRAGKDKYGVHSATNRHANLAGLSVTFFIDNSRTIASLITNGIAHRFPDLKFVSVESGIGWIPFALEALDWMWKNCGVAIEHPEYDLLPSEYFRRQMYGCFWFESGENILHTIEAVGADSVLYETDFPHSTSMTPGPGSAAVAPNEYRKAALSGLPDDARRKVLFDNAASLYGVR
jgi:predicted TIM-barrel fold metal-dependent hydrolase